VKDSCRAVGYSNKAHKVDKEAVYSKSMEQIRIKLIVMNLVGTIFFWSSTLHTQGISESILQHHPTENNLLRLLSFQRFYMQHQEAQYKFTIGHQ